MTQALTREDFLWMSAALGISMHGPISSLPRLFDQNGYSCSEIPEIAKHYQALQDRGLLFTWAPYGTKPIFVVSEAGVKAFRKHYKDNKADYVERRYQSFYMD